MTMPRVVAISQHAQQRAIQKVADLFTGFSLIVRRPGRWHQATAVGAKPEATISRPSFRSALIAVVPPQSTRELKSTLSCPFITAPADRRASLEAGFRSGLLHLLIGLLLGWRHRGPIFLIFIKSAK